SLPTATTCPGSCATSSSATRPSKRRSRACRGKPPGRLARTALPDPGREEGGDGPGHWHASAAVTADARGSCCRNKRPFITATLSYARGQCLVKAFADNQERAQRVCYMPGMHSTGRWLKMIVAEPLPDLGDPLPAGATAVQARLAEAAIELFYERGALATTVRDITGACGLTPGALYNHFESKDHLLYLVVRDIHRQVDDQLAVLIAAAGEHPVTQLTAAVRFLVSHTAGFKKRSR